MQSHNTHWISLWDELPHRILGGVVLRQLQPIGGRGLWWGFLSNIFEFIFRFSVTFYDNKNVLIKKLLFRPSAPYKHLWCWLYSVLTWGSYNFRSLCESVLLHSLLLQWIIRTILTVTVPDSPLLSALCSTGTLWNPIN